MNYFLLAETDFFRLINEAGDCNMETGIHGFRHPSDRTVQRRHGHEPYRHRACLHRNRVAAPSRAQPVRRKERDCRLCQQGPVFREEDAEIPCHAQVPPLISANNTTETATSLLQWTGNAIDLVELIYGIDEMGCINNGNMPLKQLAPLLYKIFGVESKDCYRFYTDIKRRKNESRTYFLDRMQEKLNERMLRDDELDRMRR